MFDKATRKGLNNDCYVVMQIVSQELVCVIGVFENLEIAEAVAKTFKGTTVVHKSQYWNAGI